MKRRLPSKIGGGRPKQDFFLVLAFIILAVSAMFLGGYYFLKKHERQYQESTMIVPKPIDAVQESSSPAPEPLEEQGDTAILEDVFSDSELVQIYKTKGKKSTYWQLPMKQCAHKGPSVVLAVHQGKDLTKEDFAALDALGVPVTLLILPDQASYDQAYPWATTQGHDLFLSLPMEPSDMTQLPASVEKNTVLMGSMSPKAMADYLDGFLADRKVLGIASRMGSAFTVDCDAMEKLLLHLKQRGLVFLDAVTTGQTVTEEISKKVLALSMRRHLHWEQVKEKFEGMLKTHRLLLIYVPLKARVLKQLRPWIQKQKTRVAFVRAQDWFCSPRLLSH